MKALYVLVFSLCLTVCSLASSEAKDILMMDTFVSIEIKDRLTSDKRKKLINKVENRMKELARKFDYFNPESELARLNNLEKDGQVEISEEMREILEKSRKFYEETKGVFDVRRANKIDLGGIAKGFIVDKGIEILKREGITSAIINAGGDLYCIGKGRIGIRDPKNENAIVGVFEIENQAVATSGDYERPGHIFDPRTGKTVEKRFKSVTVVADSCSKADALATALFVLDIKKGISLIENIENAECAVIDEKSTFHVSRGMPQITLTKYKNIGDNI